MPYNYLTFPNAALILASRLQDPSQIYWNQPSQLVNCVVEAVRVLQALTGSYKQKLTFNTSANVNYYDLGVVSSDPLASLASTVTDVEVANNALAALLEPPLTSYVSASPAWKGTGQFTFTQLQNALQNRMNRYLGDTGRHVIQQTIPGPTPPEDLTTLPDGVLDVRRAAWIPVGFAGPVTSSTAPLGRLDEWAEQAYTPEAPQTPNVPLTYSVYASGPLALRTVPPPLSNGLLDCIFGMSGPALNLNPGAPVTIPLSDDLTPALKWGMLAELLATDGPSRDYVRAAYCEQRYNELVDAGRIYASVLTAAINEQTCGVGSVFDMDFYEPDWQSATPAVPSFVGMASRRLACIGPTPDNGAAGGNPGNNYSVSLWASVNAPATGYIQLSRDLLDPVLDYAYHIACFQMGGQEFSDTTGFYQNLIAAAKKQNGRLEAISFYKAQLEQPARKSETETARMLA